MVDLAAALLLARSCAPTVAPVTLLALARAESGLDPLTIGVNGRSHRALHPGTPQEADRAAEALLRQGRSLDLGLTQINVRNLAPLGLSVSDAFDPCRNLAAGARLLTHNYLAVAGSSDGAQAALRVALSVYNTGSRTRGLRNGYVARVYRAAAEVVPAIAPLGQEPPPDLSTLSAETPVRLRATDYGAEGKPEAPSLDPFMRPDPALLVWRGTSAKPTQTPTSTPSSSDDGAPR